MNRKMMKAVGLSVILGVVLFLAVVAANAQAMCVLHTAGDIVPCGHVVYTAWGPRQLHPYDLIPCTHLVPCY
jgi:hypothetical protein